MAGARLKLFNIGSGLPFLDVLVDAILEDRLGLGVDMADPSVLARTTVYLPTRRAARAFLRTIGGRFDGRPLLLPRVVPLGDVDGAELSALAGAAGAETAKILPSIDPLRRRLELTRLVLACGRAVDRTAIGLDSRQAPVMPVTRVDAFGLAGDLAALLDQLQIENVPYAAIRNLDTANADELWAVTAAFLDIIGLAWPAFLDDNGCCDPATWRNHILDAERMRIAADQQSGPVIAAGSTGTVPATARLLHVIAQQRLGAVVLPGLDNALDHESWSSILSGSEPVASHPQFALAHLLDSMGATRADVAELGIAAPVKRVSTARARLVQEALRPAASSEAWFGLDQRLPPRDVADAFSGLTVIEAGDERTQALAIAIAMRDVLETPEKTAALITPDRGLAERVAIELQRWGIHVDDTAGRPLSRTQGGHLAALVLDVAVSDFSIVAVLRLLNHSGTRLGLAAADIKAAASTLEIGAVRGVALGPGLAGIRNALDRAPERARARHAPRPRKALTPERFAEADHVLFRLEACLRPLVAAMAGSPPDLATIVAAHRQVFIGVLAEATGDGDEAMPAGPGMQDDIGGVLMVFDAIANAGHVREVLESPRDYVDIFAALIDEAVVTPARSGHPRLAIWGLLEARLLQADRLILGGLSEGVWPPGTRTDALLNRSMRRQAGLSSPEQRIGQTAHDFVQAISVPDAIIARSAKDAGAETIPSRFWQRLKAVAPPEYWDAAKARGDDWLGLAMRLSQPGATEPRERPRPCPPARLQPSSLSVTEIETLYRDPYEIYARHVLRLDPLEDMVVEPTAADRGVLLHAIVEQFARTYPQQLPADAFERLIQIGTRCFAESHDAPEVAAFWWPRFVAIAGRFIRWEQARRGDIASIHTEMSAAFDFPIPDHGPFRLRARADRIEKTRSARLRIIDFKTGTVPSARQIDKGFAPQLTLQEALAVRGGFAGVGAGPVERSLYVHLSHEKDTLTERPALKDAPTPDMSELHLARLLKHIALYRSGKLPFLPHRALEQSRHARSYDQLARVKEWSGAHTDDEGAP